MQTKKVLIVGAGPAGLSAAIELGKNSGFDVTVIEKKESPEYKICAGGIEYDFVIAKLSEILVERAFKVLKFTSPYETVRIEKNIALLSTIDRKILNEHLSKEAANAGVKIIYGESIRDLGKNTVTTNNGKFYEFDFLIGADGSNSLVRKIIGIKTKKIIATFQYIIQGYYPDIEFIVDFEKFGFSYVWIFPHKNFASVGAGFYPHDSKKFRMEDLMNNFKAWAKGKFDLSKAKLEAFSINYDYRGFEFGNVYLAGDAAGFASGLTGEGIKFAILSGTDVAKKIIDRNYDCREIKKILRIKKTSETFRELLKINPILGKFALKLFTFSLKKDFGRRIISKIS